MDGTTTNTTAAVVAVAIIAVAASVIVAALPFSTEFRRFWHHHETCSLIIHAHTTLPCTHVLMTRLLSIITMQMESRMFMCCACHLYSGPRKAFMPHRIDSVRSRFLFVWFCFALCCHSTHVKSYLLMGVVHLESWIEWNMSNMVWTLAMDIRHLVCVCGVTYFKNENENGITIAATGQHTIPIDRVIVSIIFSKHRNIFIIMTRRC